MFERRYAAGMPLYWLRYDAKDENELWRRLLPYNDHTGVFGQNQGSWYVLRGADRDQMRRIWHRTKSLVRDGGTGGLHTPQDQDANTGQS